jgi:DNA polymerase sigma
MDHFFLLWKIIAKPRVPIVKFVERNSEIAFDIRLNFVSSLLMYFLLVLVLCVVISLFVLASLWMVGHKQLTSSRYLVQMDN